MLFVYPFLTFFLLFSPLVSAQVAGEGRLTVEQGEELQEKENIIDLDAEIERLELEVKELREKQANEEVKAGEEGLYEWGEAADGTEAAEQADMTADQLEDQIKVLKLRRRRLIEEYAEDDSSQ